MTSSDQTSITITHSYINATSWFLKLLYRCHIDYQQRTEKSDPRGEPIRHAKDRVLLKLYEETVRTFVKNFAQNVEKECDNSPETLENIKVLATEQKIMIAFCKQK